MTDEHFVNKRGFIFATISGVKNAYRIIWRERKNDIARATHIYDSEIFPTYDNAKQRIEQQSG